MDENLAKIRHERSKKDFPGLKLDEGEYVEYFFKRAKVCLWMIWGATFAGLVMILLAFLIVLTNQTAIDEMGKNFLFIGNVAPILAFLSYLLPIKIRYLGNLSERQMRFMESSGKKTVLYAYGVR